MNTATHKIIHTHAPSLIKKSKMSKTSKTSKTSETSKTSKTSKTFETSKTSIYSTMEGLKMLASTAELYDKNRPFNLPSVSSCTSDIHNVTAALNHAKFATKYSVEIANDITTTMLNPLFTLKRTPCQHENHINELTTELRHMSDRVMVLSRELNNMNGLYLAECRAKGSAQACLASAESFINSLPTHMR
jgi:hypothetical protein